MEIKKITRISILLSLSVVLSIIESLIPVVNGTIPGLKIGLANIAIMIALYAYGIKEAIFISIARIFIVGLLRTGLFNITFLFSMGGAVLSLIAMIIMKKSNIFSIIGVSIIGSTFHTIGQIIVAMIFIRNTSILYYLPILLLFAIPTGLLIGYISKQLMPNFQEKC